MELCLSLAASWKSLHLSRCHCFSAAVGIGSPFPATMAHLSSSAIFSPSVARQQLATARDWNYIDSWLSAKFSGKTPPPFERNADTLKAFLALASLNETADEERELLAKVETAALADLKTKVDANSNKQVLKSLDDSLAHEGQASLETLSSLSTALNHTIPSLERLGRSIIGLHITSHDTDQATDRVLILDKHLSGELERIKCFIIDLQSGTYRPPSESGKQTMEYQRKLKTLALRLPELEERVAALSATARSNILIRDVKSEEDLYQDSMTAVKDLEMQVRSYHGLPQDTDLARLELESVRAELRELTKERDSMFEGLVERETPRKPRP